MKRRMMCKSKVSADSLILYFHKLFIKNYMQDPQLPQKAKDNSQKPETLLKSKTTIEFTDKIRDFFFYQSHIICKATKKIVVFNTLTKTTSNVPVQRDDFTVEFMPPYLFALIEGQFLTLYQQDFANTQAKKAKISKMQPLSICKFNKGYIMGGFNKSSLPGNKRTNKKLIYFMEKLSFEEKNLPDDTVRLRDSEQPVSHLCVQNPYLFAYCRPTFYLISIQSKETLITFEKEALSFLILEGRYAFSSLNGIGISIKNTIYTFDVQRYPLYGVEVTQHLYTAECLCRQKSGRIFGGHGNIIFEYNPIKKYSKCWALYPEQQCMVSIKCTPSNSLMALRVNKQGKYAIDVFGIE